MRNQIEFVVHGDFALFTDPITKGGGEKLSYQIPTYQALKGIVESIYWKPSISWIIDEVRVLNPIKMESKGKRYPSYTNKDPYKNKDDATLAYHTYLKDVRYQVKAHFVFNENRPDLSYDWNEHKHHNIAKRCVDRGGRRDVFLGVRECPGYVEPCTFDEGEGFYDNYGGSIHFGTMFHGFNYPEDTGRNTLEARLWQPVMENGRIAFIKPGECKTVRELSKMEPEAFSNDSFQSVEELEKEIMD